MIQIPTAYVILLGYFIIGVVVGFIVRRIIRTVRRIIRTVRRRRRDQQEQEQQSEITLTQALINQCLQYDIIYTRSVDRDGDPLCPKCRRYARKSKLLSHYGFPFHWWLCRCKRDNCDFQWIMIANDDRLSSCKQRVKDYLKDDDDNRHVRITSGNEHIVITIPKIITDHAPWIIPTLEKNVEMVNMEMGTDIGIKQVFTKDAEVWPPTTKEQNDYANLPRWQQIYVQIKDRGYFEGRITLDQWQQIVADIRCLTVRGHESRLTA